MMPKTYTYSSHSIEKITSKVDKNYSPKDDYLILIIHPTLKPLTMEQVSKIHRYIKTIVAE
jgi:hypothetical protein